MSLKLSFCHSFGRPSISLLSLCSSIQWAQRYQPSITVVADCWARILSGRVSSSALIAPPILHIGPPPLATRLFQIPQPPPWLWPLHMPGLLPKAAVTPFYTPLPPPSSILDSSSGQPSWFVLCAHPAPNTLHHHSVVKWWLLLGSLPPPLDCVPFTVKFPGPSWNLI